MQKGVLMEHLTNIIAEISQIEDRATMLINSANEEKNSLSKAQEQRIKEFDETQKQQTQSKIAAIQEELQAQMKRDLDLQRAKTNELLEAMQKEFDETHTQLARQIVKSIIGA